ncbi:hypothetical protein LXL04_005791 [Taraxacum kok-saghyz]
MAASLFRDLLLTTASHHQIHPRSASHDSVSFSHGVGDGSDRHDDEVVKEGSDVGRHTFVAPRSSGICSAFVFQLSLRKFQLPELNSGWKKKLFIILHEKLKIPDMNMMAIFSLSPKVWTLIVMWFILAPITHRWDVGPLYILGTGFAIIFLNLGHRAYSIFNEDFISMVLTC